MVDDSQLLIERVQTGVRIEKRLLKVLKALAEYHDMSLGDLLEGIVLHAFDGKTPTDVFRQHFLTCFISDPSGLLLRDRIGIDNIAFETDYPHSDCIFPGAPEDLWQHYTDCKATDAERNKMGFENACKFFRFDPFKHICKEQATVGALRARALASGVDARTHSKAEYRAAYQATHSAAP